MNIKVSSFFLLVCGALPLVYSGSYYQQSVRSHVFKPIRPTHPPKSITECNTVVKEPYGVLEKTFTRGEKEGSSCSWTLTAPANHVINVISVAFNLTDRKSEELHPDVYSGSWLNIYDGASADASKKLTGYMVMERQGPSSHFVSSISSKQEMLVTLAYSENVDYATQKVAVTYEFLNVDDMKRLLKQA